MKNILGLIISISSLCFLLADCAPHRVKPGVDQYGCPKPPTDAFTAVGIDINGAEILFKELRLGTINLKTQPKVLSQASELSQNMLVRDWIKCQAIKRDKLTPEEATRLDDLNAFLSLNPSPEEFIQWSKENPPPNKNSFSITPEDQLFHVLIPSNEPDPNHYCGELPTDAMKVFLGGSVSWTTKRKEHTVLEIAGQKIISLKNTPAGIYLSATFIREDGRIIAKMIDNQIHINPNNYFQPPIRPDRHELIVKDKNDQIALRARYINESSILIEGQFCMPGCPDLNVFHDKIIFGKINKPKATFAGVCAGNSGKADFAFCSPSN